MAFTKNLKRLYHFTYGSERNLSDLSLSHDFHRGGNRIGGISSHRLAVGCRSVPLGIPFDSFCPGAFPVSDDPKTLSFGQNALDCRRNGLPNALGGFVDRHKIVQQQKALYARDRKQTSSQRMIFSRFGVKKAHRLVADSLVQNEFHRVRIRRGLDFNHFHVLFRLPAKTGIVQSGAPVEKNLAKLSGLIPRIRIASNRRKQKGAYAGS